MLDSLLQRQVSEIDFFRTPRELAPSGGAELAAELADRTIELRGGLATELRAGLATELRGGLP